MNHKKELKGFALITKHIYILIPLNKNGA